MPMPPFAKADEYAFLQSVSTRPRPKAEVRVIKAHAA
jgi:hypothetical protein